MNNHNLARLSFLLQTSERLKRHLELTARRLFSGPVDKAWVERLDQDVDLAERLDAFVARFGRLQDTIADKLIPEVMRLSLETPGSAIDNLNRMEQLGLISSASDWLDARNLRNKLIHEYMRDPEMFAAALNRARELVPLLTSSFDAINEYAYSHWGDQLARYAMST